MAVKARLHFSWTDPMTDEEYENICTTADMLNLLENVIEEEEQAESFFEAYSEVSDDAEYNIGYFINLIKDDDIKEDALDLFMVDLQTIPKQMLNRPYSLSIWVRGNGG